MTWEWKNGEHDWRAYTPEINDRILAAVATNTPFFDLELPNLGTYTIDLVDNRQIQKNNQKRWRHIRFNKNVTPASAPSTSTAAPSTASPAASPAKQPHISIVARYQCYTLMYTGKRYAVVPNPADQSPAMTPVMRTPKDHPQYPGVEVIYYDGNYYELLDLGLYPPFKTQNQPGAPNPLVNTGSQATSSATASQNSVPNAGTNTSSTGTPQAADQGRPFEHPSSGFPENETYVRPSSGSKDFSNVYVNPPSTGDSAGLHMRNAGSTSGGAMSSVYSGFSSAHPSVVPPGASVDHTLPDTARLHTSAARTEAYRANSGPYPDPYPRQPSAPVSIQDFRAQSISSSQHSVKLSAEEEKLFKEASLSSSPTRERLADPFNVYSAQREFADALSISPTQERLAAPKDVRIGMPNQPVNFGPAPSAPQASPGVGSNVGSDANVGHNAAIVPGSSMTPLKARLDYLNIALNQISIFQRQKPHYSEGLHAMILPGLVDCVRVVLDMAPELFNDMTQRGNVFTWLIDWVKRVLAVLENAPIPQVATLYINPQTNMQEQRLLGNETAERHRKSLISLAGNIANIIEELRTQTPAAQSNLVISQRLGPLIEEASQPMLADQFQGQRRF